MKTLKDLTEKEWNIEITPEEYFANINKLKEAAREEIIRLEKIKAKKSAACDYIGFEIERNKIDWIKEFFNLEE